MDKIIQLLINGNYREAANFLIERYNTDPKQKTAAWEILEEVYIKPNLEEIMVCYENNKKYIELNAAPCFLPPIGLLDYQLVPIDQDVFALIDMKTDKIIHDGIANKVQMLYLKLFTDDSQQLSDCEYETLKKESNEYIKKASEIKKWIWKELKSNATSCEEKVTVALKQYLMLSNDIEGYLLALAFCKFKQREYIQAKETLKAFFATNRLHIGANLLLAEICGKLGDKLCEGKILMQVFLMANDQQAIISPELFQMVSQKFGIWINQSNSAMKSQVFEIPSECFFFPRYMTLNLNRKNELELTTKNLYGNYMHHNLNGFDNFVALSSDTYEGVSFEAAQLYDMSGSMNLYMGIKTETVLSKTAKQLQIGQEGKKYILPLCGLEVRQSITIKKAAGKALDAHLRKLEYLYTLIDGPVKLESDHEFIFGKPIPLEHDLKRKRLVINILMDAGAYTLIRDTDFSFCPNIKHFFEQGIIFDHNFCAAEYTTPALPSALTGLYQANHQMFNKRARIKISNDVKTIAEKYSNSGYYTALVTAHSHMQYTNVIKGFDKIIEQFGYNYLIHDIIQDAIEHIDAFKETDNFVWISLLDLHRVLENIKLPLKIQAEHSLDELEFDDLTAKSVYKKKNLVRTEAYEEVLKLVDRQLGLLFDYIKMNYTENDYVVSLCADHGVSFLDGDQRLLKKSHTNTVAMYRGAGIPKRGIVEDEMTSAVDLFPALCHLAGIACDETKIDGRLPKAFGGQGHEYVFSESLYPGQTYKLCIRNLEYEYFLETAAFTSYDGKVDMSQYQTELFKRSDHQKIKDKKLEKVFLNEAYKFLRQNGELKYSL